MERDEQPAIDQAIMRLVEQRRSLERMLAQTNESIEHLQGLGETIRYAHHCPHCTTGSSDRGYRTEAALDEHLANVHEDEAARRRLVAREPAEAVPT